MHTRCSAERMGEKGLLLHVPAGTGILKAENTQKSAAAEAQMRLERHPAALLNPAGMCPA